MCLLSHLVVSVVTDKEITLIKMNFDFPSPFNSILSSVHKDNHFIFCILFFSVQKLKIGLQNSCIILRLFQTETLISLKDVTFHYIFALVYIM